MVLSLKYPIIVGNKIIRAMKSEIKKKITELYEMIELSADPMFEDNEITEDQANEAMDHLLLAALELGITL